MIKQKYPGAVSSKSVKDKELERKKEQKRKPGEGIYKKGGSMYYLVLPKLFLDDVSQRPSDPLIL